MDHYLLIGGVWITAVVGICPVVILAVRAGERSVHQGPTLDEIRAANAARRHAMHRAEAVSRAVHADPDGGVSIATGRIPRHDADTATTAVQPAVSDVDAARDALARSDDGAPPLPGDPEQIAWYDDALHRTWLDHLAQLDAARCPADIVEVDR